MIIETEEIRRRGEGRGKGSEESMRGIQKRRVCTYLPLSWMS
jgi:hypothetical protein